MSSNSDDDDTPQLSAQALSALHEFLSERHQEESESKEQKAAKVGGIQEDWVRKHNFFKVGILYIYWGQQIQVTVDEGTIKWNRNKHCLMTGIPIQ